MLYGALASAAASVFEAMPFVLAAAVVPSRRLRALLPLAACGCGGTLPAALALPSIALCWLTFGPWVTLARTAAALGLAAFAALRRRRRPGSDVAASAPAARGDPCPPRPVEPAYDPLAELNRLGLAAFGAALVTEGLRSGVFDLGGTLGAAVAFVAGALAGVLAPCGTAGIAAAAALRAASPAAAAGVLASSGLFVASGQLRISRLQRVFSRLLPSRLQPNRPEKALREARLAMIVVAGAALVLALEGGRGFLNPRFLVLAPAGALLAMLCTLKAPRTNVRLPFVLPAMLLIALIAGSPPPAERAATIPLGLYPGQHVDFIGRLSADRRAVVRAAILCCRADAQTLALGLDRAAPFAPGTWLEVRGVAFNAANTPRVRIAELHAIQAPPDPFLYL